eukprot:PhM_4_TR3107/c0_g1_i1/m.61034
MGCATSTSVVVPTQHHASDLTKAKRQRGLRGHQGGGGRGGNVETDTPLTAAATTTMNDEPKVFTDVFAPPTTTEDSDHQQQQQPHPNPRVVSWVKKSMPDVVVRSSSREDESDNNKQVVVGVGAIEPIPETDIQSWVFSGSQIPDAAVE